MRIIKSSPFVECAPYDLISSTPLLLHRDAGVEQFGAARTVMGTAHSEDFTSLLFLITHTTITPFLLSMACLAYFRPISRSLKQEDCAYDWLALAYLGTSHLRSDVAVNNRQLPRAINIGGVGNITPTRVLNCTAYPFTTVYRE